MSWALFLHSLGCILTIGETGIVIRCSARNGQRVSVMDALKSITINAAYQYFEEKTKGGHATRWSHLEAGKKQIQPQSRPAERISEAIFSATSRAVSVCSASLVFVTIFQMGSSVFRS